MELWQDLMAASCLLLAMEGLLLAFFPRKMKELWALVSQFPDKQIAIVGSLAGLVGIVSYLLMRGILFAVA